MSFRNPTTGGGGGIPTATDSTIVNVPNPYDAGHTMHMVQFAGDQPALAFGIEGDDFPRIVFVSDPTDALVYMGDGTSDPFSGDISFGIDFTDHTKFAFQMPIEFMKAISAGAITASGITTSGDVVIGSGPTFGPVLTSLDSTQWRIQVADDGTLSANAI